MNRRVNRFISRTAAVLTSLLTAGYVYANGMPYYLDVNGTASGFGDPLGSYTEGSNVWSTAADGTGTPGTFPANGQFTFGNPGVAGISNCVFSLGRLSNIGLIGISINVPCTVTFTGGGNAGGAQTWSVSNGATFNVNDGKWNFNGSQVTLQGAGTINFNGAIGYNSGSTIIQDMAGGVVNVRTNYVTNVNQAGYKLQNGILNFATPSSASAFSNFPPGRAFSIVGGTLDNTSGEPMTLNIGAGYFNIGGSFAFAGSSALTFTNVVNLGTVTPTVTVSQNTLTCYGALTNSGGVVKAGPGTLALAANNTYGGATTIADGTLAVAMGGSCSNSAVTLAAASAKAVLLRVPVTDTTKQWTCKSLTVNNAGTGSDMLFDFGALTPRTTLAPLNVTGGVAFTTAPAITVLGSSLPVSSGNGYPLLSWGSGSAPSLSGVALTLPLRITGNLVVAGNTLYLQITGSTAPLSWRGSDGVWDINNSGNNTVWQDNTTAGTYYQESFAGDSVVFDTTVGTGGTITLNTNVSPTSVTVSNPTANYTLSGSGGIAGATGLTKSGTGMLTLGTRNTYSGATTINDGTLAVGVGFSCSNSAVSLAATAGNTATLSLSVTNTTLHWACAALTVNNAGVASVLDFNFGTLTPSTTVAPLKITGAAAFTTVPMVTVELGAVGAAGTQYPLMTWASGSVSAPPAVTVTGQRGIAAHLTVSGTTLYLVLDAVNGTPYYLDVNGATAGFGEPSGSYNQASTSWTTNSAGTTATDTITNGSSFSLTFGYPGTSGISNSAFAVGLDFRPFYGYAINVPCTVTLNGGGYCGGSQAWFVTQGATFTLVGSVNINNVNLTLQGGGVINDNGYMGYNCNTSTIRQDMPGGKVNLLKAWAGGSANQAGYNLMNGTLNFATAASAGAFGGTNPVVRTVAFNGGALDNTSGSTMTLNVGSANYSIGGSFTFTGSSSLTLTNTVNLGTVTPTVTVIQNTLTIGGSITNTAGLNKAGAGTLVLAGANSYRGGTTVSAGTLLVDGSITGTVNVVGGTFGGAGFVNGALTNQEALTAADTNSIGTLTVNSLTMKECSSLVWNYNATTNDVIQVNGSLVLPAVATVTVSQVTSAKLPSLAVVLTGFSSLVTNSGTLDGWVIRGGQQKTHAIVRDNQVLLETKPVGTLIRVL